MGGFIGERVGVDGVDEKNGLTSSVLGADEEKAGDLGSPRARELEAESATGCVRAEVGTGVVSGT